MAEAQTTIDFETDRCKGCGLCIVACPIKLIVFRENCVNAKGYQPVMVEEAARCSGCGNCTLMCPDSVITVVRDTRTRRADHV